VSAAASTASPGAVIFDNDGLLLDTEESWTRAQHALSSATAAVHSPAQARHARVLAAAAAAGLELILDAPGEGWR